MQKDRAGRSSTAAGALLVWMTHASRMQQLHHAHTLLRHTQDVWPLRKWYGQVCFWK